MSDARKKLVGLLDYVEQVVRLDERVVFRLSEYRLPDGTAFAVTKEDTQNLPGIRHDYRDEEGSVWLEVERLVRREPPPPPKEIADWVIVPADPARPPELRTERFITVTTAERDDALAKGEVRPDDVLIAPRKRGEPENAPPRYDLKFRLEDHPEIAEAINVWISGPWSEWSTAELPRRRTIGLYQRLYKIFQLLDVGGAESSIELVWGIGVVNWQKDGRIVDRPLIERRVDIELDDMRGGLIRIRPTAADPLFDLKPYEELGCTGLVIVADLIRREIQRTGESEGISPFARESFEPILSGAAVHLDREGSYSPDTQSASSENKPSAHLTVTDGWVLFARPRSQHVVLQDINRLRRSTERSEGPMEGLPQRLVTEPSRSVPEEAWEPLSPRIGGTDGGAGPPKSADDILDVFFPKPFNDDQLEIIKRLSRSDGLVVQGPPGTGKTHTIANLICHAMATGQRVLVVSRGEAALAVLKGQLPKEVQPLAISVLSNEREGLRQVESAIREIQGVVEETQPQNRRATIARLEKELDGLRKRIASIDQELDSIALAHFGKIGPRGETPAELAQRIVSEREAFRWFVDRPPRFVSETSLDDRNVTALFAARERCGELIDHLTTHMPSPLDLPAADVIARWHEDLVAATAQGQVAAQGPVRALRIGLDNIANAQTLAQALDDLVWAHQTAAAARWLEPFRRVAISGEANPWCDRLRERIGEWVTAEDERAKLLRRAVELPDGLIDNAEACEAVGRAANGQRLWPLVALGKSTVKALVSAIRVDGAAVKEDNKEIWRHVAAVIANAMRQREARARWDVFAREVNAPTGAQAKAAIDLASKVLHVCYEARKQAALLAALTSNASSIGTLANDPNLCAAVAKQIRASANAVRLAAVEQDRRRLLGLFPGDDRTSVLAQQLLNQVLGKASITPDKVSVVWGSLLKRLGQLKALARDFETIMVVTAAIAKEGAPKWATMLRTEVPVPDDPRTSSAWRDAWDHAAADAELSRIDGRQRLTKLADEREAADKRCRQLFGEIVRERTFYQLNSRLSPAIKAALVEFVHALTKIGKGTGKTAWVHRRTARDAMGRCHAAVPCWIMPTWRVAEQLPAELGAVDLVIIDEASQSDVTELPALLRGKKLLVVGDDRQVSPTAPFVTQEKIGQLRHHYLGDMPFRNLLEPGDSVYSLMRAVFPDERLMLKEHFRCVEPIIRFSMQFYPEKMLPLRIPEAHERLDPPLIDIYLPHGTRTKRGKVNEAEADVIVNEISALTESPEMRNRTIGVISLVGSEQADYIRSLLSERIGEEIMQRHSILCGDSAAFQGSERDIVYLSMVADSANRTALTMLRYEQRFNVAVSRGRDRVVLVRSVKREELNPNDLKARLIAHFENPMPELEEIEDALSVCESNFERDLMQRLLERGYRVQGQVGSIGYRIDMVVEGADRKRLAVECDGDRYHGPEQWRQDMRRQRVLERVGWRFWRCFASSFYRDPDGVLNELFEMLTRMGIEPIKEREAGRANARFTEHRTIDPDMREPAEAAKILESEMSAMKDVPSASLSAGSGIGVGDKIVLIFSDDQKRASVRLTETGHDLEKGRLAVQSALGKVLLGAEEGDEVDFVLDNGRQCKILIESVEKSPMRNVGAFAPASAENEETAVA